MPRFSETSFISHPVLFEWDEISSSDLPTVRQCDSESDLELAPLQEEKELLFRDRARRQKSQTYRWKPI